MDTDVSTAQSFDVASFLGGLVNTAAGAYVATQTANSQATGKPAATTTPNLYAGANGNTAVAGNGLGMSNQTMLLVGVGAAALLAVLLLRKS